MRVAEKEIDMPVTLEKARLNLWNLVGFVAGITVTAFGWGVTYSNLSNSIEKQANQIQDINGRMQQEATDRKDRLKSYQDQLSGMQQQIAQITPLTFQTNKAIEGVAENKKAVEATNDRIDRVVETFGGKLDTVIENVGKLSTQVSVLSSKLDDIQGRQTDKTTYRTPIIRP